MESLSGGNMKQFNFSPDEIDKNKVSQEDWYNFVRRREAEMVFSLVPECEFESALELGAGNGLQSTIIIKHCKHLISTDVDPESHSNLGQRILERKLSNVEYRVCDAQDLSQFGDRSFDLIFSSNMLEHIPGLVSCLSECRRVLKDNGIMLHTMPSRWWKFFSFSLGLAAFKKVGVHGASSNHLTEFLSFGKKAWKTKFQVNGFSVSEIVGLPFYVGYGNRFIPIIKAGNLMHLPASYLYIVRRP